MNRIETILKDKKVFIGKTAGDSMEPMLREGRDTVVIAVPTFPLKRLDVPVYRKDGHYTMHRIIFSWKKGYVICGDNRWWPEMNVTESDIVGVLSGFYRDGSYVSCDDADYLAYAEKACNRWFLRAIKGLTRAVFHKVRKGVLKLSRL